MSLSRTTPFFRLMLIFAVIYAGVFIWASVDYLFHPLEMGLLGIHPLERAVYVLVVAQVTVLVGILAVHHNPVLHWTGASDMRSTALCNPWWDIGRGRDNQL